MIGYMISQNVLHRPLRTFITVLAVAVEVTLVIIVVGLTSGLLSESAKRTEGVGADIMVQPPPASVLMAFSGAPMPIAIGDKLRAARIRTGRGAGATFSSIRSTASTSSMALIRRLSALFPAASFFIRVMICRDPNDILVDDVYAKSKKVKSVRRFTFSITIFTSPESSSTAKARASSSSCPRCRKWQEHTIRLLSFTLSVIAPITPPQSTDEIHDLLPSYEVRPLKDFLIADDFLEPPRPRRVHQRHDRHRRGHRLPGDFSLDVHHHHRAHPRNRRLESRSARPRATSFTSSSARPRCSASRGVVAGVGLSYLMRAIFIRLFPTLTILITPGWIVRAGLIAILGGLLGAAYPAWMASRKDPVEALAYE